MCSEPRDHRITLNRKHNVVNNVENIKEKEIEKIQLIVTY